METYRRNRRAETNDYNLDFRRQLYGFPCLTNSNGLHFGFVLETCPYGSDCLYQGFQHRYPELGTGRSFCKRRRNRRIHVENYHKNGPMWGSCIDGIFLSGCAYPGPLIYRQDQWCNENRLTYRPSDGHNYELTDKFFIILEKILYILNHGVMKNKNTVKTYRVGTGKF